MTKNISPIEAAYAITPFWMLRIPEFDALEIHPCAVVGYDGSGREIAETCTPAAADFWTVYGHYRTGGVDAFEDFATEAKAREFHDQLVAIYPHLSPWAG